MQRGTCAVVMRVIPGKVPDFDSLGLPSELAKIVELRNGIVLGDWSHRLRKILNPGRHHRQN